MFLSSLRFGIIIYVAFNKDLEKINENIEIEKKKQNEQELLLNQLSKFLREQENVQGAIRAKNISQTLQERNKQK